ncbi:type I ferredoxin Etp1/cytochrome oxidase cofactor Cox15 [Schizosaccharomyces japonicus yFS275]|uniref:Type I ferredoxin Etp1/cytochrome oxidase cofactor Cox15 n=1 Tax=Schizosaccharomyces japonicus (strain yFS275 / FY16936) TaxID=402676 RepID=B6K6Q8_SCHJY|nr:type I ferredoxin Etp1/cytochrome oxidase cofactor Cox15 [Schizosaccharomyces japonicus yFS275]EEB09212.1 type I ferredoxin Etp1/cytochrome oxidase cofactor Cox15 [Schizosaccharomyces japonicus yFS275]
MFGVALPHLRLRSAAIGKLCISSAHKSIFGSLRSSSITNVSAFSRRCTFTHLSPLSQTTTKQSLLSFSPRILKNTLFPQSYKRSYSQQKSSQQQTNSNNSTSEASEQLASKRIAYWLLGSSVLVFGIVVVGGITRLTESGLSITEWKPVTGAIPPLNHEQWMEEFEAYKKTPEYVQLKANISLDEFKHIFFWEWLHRFLGRAIGLLIVVPSAYMLTKRNTSRWLRWRLVSMSGLVALQGVIGWWMVKSGLSKRLFEEGAHPRVSHYRLAIHLSAAVALYIGLIWSGTGILLRHKMLQTAKAIGVHNMENTVASINKLRGLRYLTTGLTGCVLGTLISGAFVAGLDAGMLYCNFPKMGERWIPPKSELFQSEFSRREDKSDLVWRNMLDNPVLVQLEHRILGLTTLALGCYVYFFTRKRLARVPADIFRSTKYVAGAVTAQACLGIGTLWYVVPVWLGATHQGGSLVVLTASLALLQKLLPRFAWTDVRRLLPQQAPVNSPSGDAASSGPIRVNAFQTQGRRSFFTLAPRYSHHGSSAKGDVVHITFVTPENKEITVAAHEGQSILEVAHSNDIDLEGACEGSVACSTCHVIVDPEFYDKLEPPEEDEEDMLDLAFGLEETSRLGCQVILNKDLDGIRVRLPAQTRNIRLGR